MKVTLMIIQPDFERVFMLSAKYLPDFNVTLIMKMYNNCALPFAFHFSRSPKRFIDKQKRNPPFFVFSSQVVWIYAAIADCQQWIYTGFVVHH